MSHGVEILKALRAEMSRLGRKPSDVESGAVIDDYLKVNGVKMKRKKKPGMPKVRARDEIFDLLAKLDGQDVAQLTKHGGARIGTAKSQILEVMKDSTTEQVIEQINLRWAVWCKKHTDKKVQTVMALIGHWGELGGGPAPKIRMLDRLYQQPAWDWKPDFLRIHPGADAAEWVEGKSWDDLQLSYREELIKAHDAFMNP